MTTKKRGPGRPPNAKSKYTLKDLSDQVGSLAEDLDTWTGLILHDMRILSTKISELSKPVQSAKAFAAKMNGEHWRPHFAEKKEKVPKEIEKGKYLQIEVLLRNGQNLVRAVPYETNLTWAKYGDRTIVAWRPVSGTEN